MLKFLEEFGIRLAECNRSSLECDTSSIVSSIQIFTQRESKLFLLDGNEILDLLHLFFVERIWLIVNPLQHRVIVLLLCLLELF